MLRYLLTAIMVSAVVFVVGSLLASLAAKLSRLLNYSARDPAENNISRVGYGYLFSCWLICSAVITALIWEYWF